ncbi:HNH endonuclease [Mycobacterium ostraviense]|uniref:HNH endonuclease n=1 Tax=Mycobacterium ostraviense TaxID=2738409 RepID=UPI0009E1A855|nr:HNH endonuclease [Mycobacterium ostraviense]
MRQPLRLVLYGNGELPYCSEVVLVGEIPPGIELDHTCFVRRCVNPKHLRFATPKQNMENLRGARRDNKAGLRGVFLHKPGRWRAQVGHNGKIIHCGLFDSPEEAAAAAQAKRNELFTHNDADRRTA